MNTNTDNMQDKISKDLEKDRIVLYMKGTKLMPMCGFSGRVVHILDSLEADYVTYNVLESEELRQGIKDYSDWPTIPQLYIDGEFIGGCDIVTQLNEASDLQKMLA